MKKIIFLPFINGGENDRLGLTWRNDLEANFLNDPDIRELTDKINAERNKNPGDNASAQALADYYNALHKVKAERQIRWVNRLSAETAGLFGKVIGDLPENVVQTDEQKPNDYVIVAALPEFFWYDINDNRKHLNEDKYYHKAIYGNVVMDHLGTSDNPIAVLTARYKNLIFFAGTTVWKQINASDHTKDSSFNTMHIYHSGKHIDTWTKYFPSNIDGVSLAKKWEKAKRDTKYVYAPITEFKGVKFTYDICLDFSVKIGGVAQPPLSTIFCNGEKTDVNILIAAGMPIYDKDLTNINSPVILRCDGLSAPYGEIASNGAYPANNPLKISGGTDIVGNLEIEIDTQS
ncbi:MAG: hypothetical protein J1F60_03365 [Oscillospiraceae bacterium]|nr:hypothetical protein [Oscillospiraceae bacterium]